MEVVGSVNGLRRHVSSLCSLQTEAEARKRAAATAQMQRLPKGVVPVAAPVCGAACHVCAVEDEAEDNVMLQVIVVEQDTGLFCRTLHSDGWFLEAKSTAASLWPKEISGVQEA